MWTDKGYLHEKEEIAITYPEVFRRNLANFGLSGKHALPRPNVERTPVPDLDPTTGISQAVRYFVGRAEGGGKYQKGLDRRETRRRLGLERERETLREGG